MSTKSVAWLLYPFFFKLLSCLERVMAGSQEHHSSRAVNNSIDAMSAHHLPALPSLWCHRDITSTAAICHCFVIPEQTFCYLLFLKSGSYGMDNNPLCFISIPDIVVKDVCVEWLPVVSVCFWGFFVCLFDFVFVSCCCCFCLFLC